MNINSSYKRIKKNLNFDFLICVNVLCFLLRPKENVLESVETRVKKRRSLDPLNGLHSVEHVSMSFLI